MKYAVTADPPLRTGNPCGTGSPAASAKADPDPSSPVEEADVLLAECVEGARPMVETMLYTGLRFGEVRALRVRDLRFGKKPELTVRETITRAVNGNASARQDS